LHGVNLTVSRGEQIGIAANLMTIRPSMVLRRDIYALAALADAAVLTLGDLVGVPDAVVAALSYDWRLPRANNRRNPAE